MKRCSIDGFSRMLHVLGMSLFVLSILSFASDSLAGFYGKSYALVVGIDEYPSPGWKQLDYAKRDAKGIAAFLERQGFEVAPLRKRELRPVGPNLLDGLCPAFFDLRTFCSIPLRQKLRPQLPDRLIVHGFCLGDQSAIQVFLNRRQNPAYRLARMCL